ncbi:unnamed protein product [Nesidiocoris tenuis]|uniref:Uncharacterized protein n=1 Tax=Nesidiocoris tenuis TaxID=355587 RepID=A0A6H5HA98_9HEMI|nr:unnamed protein product [Nesidiocoris tenuis]
MFPKIFFLNSKTKILRPRTLKSPVLIIEKPQRYNSSSDNASFVHWLYIVNLCGCGNVIMPECWGEAFAIKASTISPTPPSHTSTLVHTLIRLPVSLSSSPIPNHPGPVPWPFNVFVTEHRYRHTAPIAGFPFSASAEGYPECNNRSILQHYRYYTRYYVDINTMTSPKMIFTSIFTYRVFEQYAARLSLAAERWAMRRRIPCAVFVAATPASPQLEPPFSAFLASDLQRCRLFADTQGVDSRSYELYKSVQRFKRSRKTIRFPFSRKNVRNTEPILIIDGSFT